MFSFLVERENTRLSGEPLEWVCSGRVSWVEAKRRLLAWQEKGYVTRLRICIAIPWFNPRRRKLK